LKEYLDESGWMMILSVGHRVLD